MIRRLLFIVIFITLLVPAWWLNEWIAREATIRFDHFATDFTRMTEGQIDRFWPPLNDNEWTREPPEDAQKTTRWGFTRWMIAHTSGAKLVIWAYEAGFPMRSFLGEIRSDPNNGDREINLVPIEDAPEHLLPTGRLWFGTIVNMVCYAGVGWLVLCGPVWWLTRSKKEEE